MPVRWSTTLRPHSSNPRRMTSVSEWSVTNRRPGLELAPQLGVVVDLAVEDEREVAVVAVERLVAGRDVDDREAAHADREVLRRRRCPGRRGRGARSTAASARAVRDRNRRTRRCHTSGADLRAALGRRSVGFGRRLGARADVAVEPSVDRARRRATSSTIRSSAPAVCSHFGAPNCGRRACPSS